MAMNEQRLIDAIAYCKELYLERDYHGRTQEFMDAIEVAIADLSDMPTVNAKEIIFAEWEMVVDDFDDGFGNRELPHCSNCHRGVYRHDAGSWCPFCGAAMKNPMR